MSSRDKNAIDKEVITTKKDFLREFKKIGLNESMHVIVHCSLSKFGYVVNGANDIIDALFDIVGSTGTVLVSTNTGQLTDPEGWGNPPVPEKFVDVIRKNMRCFDKKNTPAHNRGILADVFLYYENVERSEHALRSIAAKGRLAKYYTETHPLHDSEGIGSPLYKLFRTRGYALLIGVDLDRCSAIHVAEYLADVPYLYEGNCKVLIKNEKGENEFVKLKKDVIAPNYKHYFPKLEPALVEKGYMKVAKFYDVSIKLVKISEMVNYIVNMLKSDSEYLLKP